MKCVLVGAFATPAAARAEETPPLDAKMQCERASEPGRVRCSVEVHVPPTRSIAWADVVVVQLPAFASALKGRIGPTDATAREPTSVRWAFALVARHAGQGEARARVRVVSCEGARCVPRAIDVRATLDVGG